MISYLSVEESLPNFKKKVWIIDKNVYNLNFDRINSIKVNDNFFILESLEENKTIDTYNEILKFLFENKIDRSYYLIGLGGGIVGDITGFVASTYKRGMKLIHIPTTLLSMVDSSIGGKTGVNNDYGKNMIGTFYKASNIIVDKTWLNTLPIEQKINGMAEIIKMALLKGGRLYELVNNSNPETWENLDEMIRVSGEAKVEIIENDLNETKGVRDILNLGHTFGHAHELSNEVLHGYAISDGTIDEFYYTNYYYGYPSNTFINNVKNLLIKWKLHDPKKPISYNKMFYYYLENDKKNNKLITLKDVGYPSIVEFNIEKIKLFKANFYRLRNFYNSKNVFYEKTNFVVDLPSSKSETNRLLLIATFISYFINKKIFLENILDSKDTKLMINSLDNHIEKSNDKYSLTINPVPFIPKKYYYLGNSGTCVRFLLPILAFSCKEEILLDCSEEMKKRPIKPLVKSLTDIGCKITYKENNDYLPLIIKPPNKILNSVKIDGTLSSQYVTGLLIGYCYLYLQDYQIYEIILDGENTSSGFIDMTIDILNNFGFSIKKPKEDKIIVINKWSEFYGPKYTIESDLSSASYLIAWSYINKFDLTLNNVKLSSTQPDFKILDKMSKYFGDVNYEDDKMIFKPFEKVNIDKDEIIIDLDSSDTFLTWAILFVVEKIQRKKNFISKIIIENIENQDWKECKRITGLLDNLKKLDIILERTKTGFNIPEIIEFNMMNALHSKDYIMETFNDHRMAMSFSILAMINRNVLIENPLCVDKTFPTYWELIQKIGVGIEPIRNIIDNKKIILIGMPGCGKSTFGKILQEKLGFENVDLDKLITDEIGTPIHDIIERHGWAKFRDIESTKLYTLLNYSKENLWRCISTGGGIVDNKISRDLIENGIIIWIRRDLESIKTSLKEKNRKLPNTLENLMKSRKKYYENLSDYIYDNNGDEENFIKWFKVVFNNNPIPINSTFLCKTNDIYEENISNIVELRGDLMENFGIDKIQSTMINFNRQIIYTLRSEKEFGNFKLNTLYSKEFYEKLIFDAIKLGCRVIDVEINQYLENENFLQKIFSNKNNVQILSSVHEKEDFSEIKKNIIFKIPKYDLLKFVIPENCLNKILKLKKSSFSELDFGKTTFFENKNFCKNEILSSNLDSEIQDPDFLNNKILKLKKSSFSKLDFGIWINFENENFRLKNNFLTPIRSSKFPGTFSNQLNLFQYLKNKYLQNKDTKFIFLFGSDIGQSPSSYIHNFVLNKTYRDEIYFNLETDNLKIIQDVINEEYFFGASITMPFKECLSEKNVTLESINTILKHENKLEKINTDEMALKYSIEKINTKNINKIYIFGTGGAAIGAINASLNYNFEITIIGRNLEKINELKYKYNDVKHEILSDKLELKLNDCIVINCLPPSVSINKYLSDNVKYIDMTYGLHNFKNKLNYKNYISGYEILYVQAAFQYMFWYNLEEKYTNEILNLYYLSMVEYLGDRSLLDSKF